MRKFLALSVLAILTACGSGGYSFTGGDVGNAKTISVDFFPNYAPIVQPQLSQLFTEALRDIFVRQTSLELVDRGGDLHFEGSIVGYDVKPVNAQSSGGIDAGGQAAANRLTITVNVIYTNKLEEKKSFEQRFSRFADFDANVDLSQVEGELMDQISTELAENILNQSIGSW